MKFNSLKSTTIKLLLSLTCLLLLSRTGYSQIISAADKKKLLAKEDTLKEYARYLVMDSLTEDRMISDSIFTRTLVRALQIRYRAFPNCMHRIAHSGSLPGIYCSMIFIHARRELFN
jgi:hypothetical protein